MWARHATRTRLDDLLDAAAGMVGGASGMWEGRRGQAGGAIATGSVWP